MDRLAPVASATIKFYSNRSNLTAKFLSMNESPSTKFLQLRSDNDRKDFFAKLKAPTWWLGGKSRSSVFGWVDVFEASDGKCVYCARDLAASTDALAESTEEHLVPRSSLEANKAVFDNEHNMAVCCAGCNTLKGEFVPPASDASWKNRKAFIKACSRFIAQRRLANFQKYKTRVENVLKKRAGL